MQLGESLERVGVEFVIEIEQGGDRVLRRTAEKGLDDAAKRRLPSLLPGSRR